VGRHISQNTKKEHKTMMRILRLPLAATAGLSVAAIAAIAAPQPERLRGTVSAVSVSELSVHTATGEVSISLGSDTKYLRATRSNLNHIANDSYVGVATKNVGGKLVALDVLIFPLSLKGAAEGHFGWDRLPDTTLAGGASTGSGMTNGSVAAVAQGGSAAAVNSTMTNGSVAAESGRGGVRQLTVTYKGGQEMILVPPTAPVATLRIGGVSDIRPGDSVFVNALADSGKTSAGLIIFGANGALPPI
jgi:hypothetical protein